MPSATALVGEGGARLLRASELDRNVSQITVVFKSVDVPPEGIRSPLIAWLTKEVIPGRDQIPLNATNIRTLVDLLGDDYSLWAGAKVTFAKISTRNPQTGASTWGLRVIAAERPAKQASAPAQAKRKPAADDDVPF